MHSYLKSSTTACVNISMNVFKLSHLVTNLILFSLLFFFFFLRGRGWGQGTWVEVTFDSWSSCPRLLSARVALVYQHPRPTNLILKAPR